MKETAQQLTAEQVNQILHRSCSLVEHGGGVEVVSIVSNCVRIRFVGACAHCLGGQEDTRSRIQQLLRDQLQNSEIEVRVAQGVSPSLIAEAQRILNRNK